MTRPAARVCWVNGSALEQATVLGRSASGDVSLIVSGMGKVKAVQVSPALFSRDVTHAQEAILQAIQSAAAS